MDAIDLSGFRFVLHLLLLIANEIPPSLLCTVFVYPRNKSNHFFDQIDGLSFQNKKFLVLQKELVAL